MSIKKVSEFPKLYKGDCLEVMQNIPDGSIDMIKNKVEFLIVDYPDYGKDVCDWSDEDIHNMLKTLIAYTTGGLKENETEKG